MSSKYLRYAASASFAVLLVGAASADSLSERRAAKAKVENIEVEVACGKLDKENCAIVIPAINEKTVSQGIRLKPLESKGSVESMDALCDGDINMAVVQADVFAKRGSQTDCTGKVSVVGSPLYPYDGFAIVRADAKGDTFGEMIAKLPQGSALRVAAGGSGSGGELTLRNILAKNPEWKQSVDIQPDNAATGLNKLRDRQLDVLYVMDGPQSPLLQDVRETVEPKTKDPIYKFLDIRPNEALLNLSYGPRQKLYATATLEPGWWGAKKATIQTPAVLVLREDFYQSKPEVVSRIRQAAEDALPAIAAKAGARPDWAKVFFAD